jgi:hypothetical protein
VSLTRLESSLISACSFCVNGRSPEIRNIDTHSFDRGEGGKGKFDPTTIEQRKQVRFKVVRIVSSSSYNIITIQLELEMIANANPNVCLWL